MSTAHAGNRRRPPPLRAVRAFAAAARHMSLTRAADELAVTQSAISRQVRELEKDLGVLLFERRGRNLRLTTEGRTFARIADDAIERLTEQAVALRGRKPSPTVTLATVPSIAARWLAPKLADFVESHPDIDLRIASSPQLLDLEADGIDAAIRYGRGRWPGVSALHLAGEELLPVCSPAYAETSALRTPDDLRHLKLLEGNLPDKWRDWLEAAGVSLGGVEHGLVFDDANTLLRAAEDGLGVALGRSVLVAPDLASGRLVAPFQLRIPATYGYWFVMPEGREADARLARVRDWLAAAFETS